MDKAERWPNGQGWDVRIWRTWYEIWPGDGLARLEADGSPTGFYRVEYTELDSCPKTAEEAIQAVRLARIDRKAWRPCE
jgi:hypothetical protein